MFIKDLIQPAGPEFDYLMTSSPSARITEFHISSDEKAVTDLISLEFTHSDSGNLPDELTIDFNVLHVEWNPETIISLVDFARSLPLQKSDESKTSELESVTETRLSVDRDGSRSTGLSKAEDHVTFRLKGSLRRFSISLNKEIESRKLALIDMGESEVSYSRYQSETFESNGVLGRFQIFDTSEHGDAWNSHEVLGLRNQKDSSVLNFRFS